MCRCSRQKLTLLLQFCKQFLLFSSQHECKLTTKAKPPLWSANHNIAYNNMAIWCQQCLNHSKRFIVMIARLHRHSPQFMLYTFFQLGETKLDHMEYIDQLSLSTMKDIPCWIYQMACIDTWACHPPSIYWVFCILDEPMLVLIGAGECLQYITNDKNTQDVEMCGLYVWLILCAIYLQCSPKSTKVQKWATPPHFFFNNENLE